MNPISFRYSIRHAFRGLISAYRTEKNIRFHVVCATVVFLFGIFFRISLSEWVSLFLVVGMVFSLELVNSAIEALIDITNPRLSEPIARVKDMLAGAVLVSSFIAIVIGLTVFLPRIIHLFL